MQRRPTRAPARPALWIAAALLSFSVACAKPPQQPQPPTAPPPAPERPEPETPAHFSGEVSYYADSLDGQPTANGETFDQQELTAAHRELPFGTRLRVTRPDTGASVVVRVNDRGPYADDRVLDLTRAAAERLGFVDDGHVHVEVEVLDRPAGGGPGSS